MQKVKYFLSWLFISIRCDLGLICCWHSFVWLDLRIFVHPNCANEIVAMSSVTMWCTMATLHILKHSWFFFCIRITHLFARSIVYAANTDGYLIKPLPLAMYCIWNYYITAMHCETAWMNQTLDHMRDFLHFNVLTSRASERTQQKIHNEQKKHIKTRIHSPYYVTKIYRRVPYKL